MNAASAPPSAVAAKQDRASRRCKEVWRLLESVPDPEIPAISVVDLGIVRQVRREGEKIIVTVTPTYSGCPATAVIALDIRAALERAGITSVEIHTQLSPPWTTDWISEEGLKKLEAYGIAPPARGECAGAISAPSCCPRCGSRKIERVSQFGSTPCKAAWRCAECLEPFEYFKRH